MTSDTVGSVRARLAAQRRPRRRLRIRGMAITGRGAVLGLYAAGALALTVLAAPRFAAQAVLLPAHEELDAIRSGTPLSEERLAAAREALALARRLDPSDGRLSTDLALIELLEADLADPARRAVKLEAAIGDLERGLAESPANAFAWARLAGARLALERRAGPKMLAALRMSYATGPYVDKIMPFRAALALANWESLGPALTSHAKRELIYLWERRGVWQENQLPLIRLLCETGRTGLLAQVLIEAHRTLDEFDKLYESHLSPAGCAKVMGK